MSKLLKGVGKVFRKVLKFAVKVLPIALAVGAVVFTGGAALGLTFAAGGWAGAVGGLASSLGISGTLGGVLAGAATAAGFGSAIGGTMAAVTGKDIMKGMQVGAATGAITGGIGGAINPAAALGTATAPSAASALPATGATQIGAPVALPSGLVNPLAVGGTSAGGNALGAAAGGAGAAAANGATGLMSGVLKFANANPTIAGSVISGVGTAIGDYASAGATSKAAMERDQAEREGYAANYGVGGTSTVATGTGLLRTADTTAGVQNQQPTPTDRYDPRTYGGQWVYDSTQQKLVYRTNPTMGA